MNFKFHPAPEQARCGARISNLRFIFSANKLIKLFGLSFILFMLLVRSANALTISPTVKEYELEAGGNVGGAINIRNENPAPVAVEISTQNFEAQGESGEPKFIDLPNDLASWIEILPESFVLKRGESKKINYKINIPANASPGGHFAGIIFEEKPVSAIAGEVALSNQVAHLILVRVPGEIVESGRIKEFFIEKLQTDPLEIKFAVRFENFGNVFLKPYGTIAVRNWFGRKVGEIYANDAGGNVLPESGRKFMSVWQNRDDKLGVKTIYFGRYKASLEMFYGSENKKEAAEISFWLINREGIILSSILGMLILLIIWQLIKQFKKRKFFVERI